MSAARREELVAAMAARVLAVLGKVDAIGRIVVLAPSRPEYWGGELAVDGGLGLNAEIAAWRSRNAADPLIVVQGDLPLVTPRDVGELVTRARRLGGALAIDRHGTGTNAVALDGGAAFEFRFGPGSGTLHSAQLADGAVVRRKGLASDIDCPADLALLDFGPWARFRDDRTQAH